MSQQNVEVVKAVQPTGVDMVALFQARTWPSPSSGST